MAGDWIKMRAGLLTHPKVVRISSALKADTFRTVGALMAVFCLFDEHSDDGHMDGYTLEVLDDYLRWPGFSAALNAVGWLEFTDENGLSLPRYDLHNGQSAKRRAQEAERKRDVRKASASEADKKRTREDKRREESNTPPTPKGGGDGTGDGGGSELPGPEFTPTPAGAVCIAIRKAGIGDTNPGHPKLKALLESGATADEFVGFAEQAAKRCLGFAWVLGAVEGERKRAKDMAGEFHRGALPSPDPPVTVPSAVPAQTQRAIAEQSGHLAEVRQADPEERRRKAAELRQRMGLKTGADLAVEQAANPTETSEQAA